jgi:hypothetical protein
MLKRFARSLFRARTTAPARRQPRQVRGDPADATGRWAIEIPWPGDECTWFNPFVAEDGKSPLTFATAQQARNFRLQRGLSKGSRIVQPPRWRLPPDALPVPPSARELLLRDEMGEAVRRRNEEFIRRWELPEGDRADEEGLSRQLGRTP